MKLEASIHQFKGDKDRTNKWLTRIGKTFDLKKLLYGQFLYYKGGGDIEILPNTTLSLTNLKD